MPLLFTFSVQVAKSYFIDMNQLTFSSHYCSCLSFICMKIDQKSYSNCACFREFKKIIRILFSFSLLLHQLFSSSIVSTVVVQSYKRFRIMDNFKNCLANSMRRFVCIQLLLFCGYSDLKEISCLNICFTSVYFIRTVLDPDLLFDLFLNSSFVLKTYLAIDLLSIDPIYFFSTILSLSL